MANFCTMSLITEGSTEKALRCELSVMSINIKKFALMNKNAFFEQYKEVDTKKKQSLKLYFFVEKNSPFYFLELYCCIFVYDKDELFYYSCKKFIL